LLLQGYDVKHFIVLMLLAAPEKIPLRSQMILGKPV
jgi:hypothetical protein